MINRRKRKFALRLKLKANTKAEKKRTWIELDVVAMLEIAFSSIRRRKGDGGGESGGSSFPYRIVEAERRGEILHPLFSPPSFPSHYATFSLRVTESIRSEQESTKCGICYACEFNDVNIWLAMAGDKRNNTGLF